MTRKAWNVRKKEWEEVEEIALETLPTEPTLEPKSVDIEDLKKLIAYAKDKGWI